MSRGAILVVALVHIHEACAWTITLPYFATIRDTLANNGPVYYKPSSSVTIGAAKPSSNYNPKGFMWNSANTPFQINLERNPSVTAYSTSNPPAGSVEYWNGLRSGSAMTTGNWVDPQHYALAIDPSATKMDIFTNGGSTIQEDGIQWTITGWGQTVLRGTIDTTSKPGKVRLVVKNGEYRPFSADIKANPQESFTGKMFTEVVAYVYSGSIADLDTTKTGAALTGKVLGAELRQQEHRGKYINCRISDPASIGGPVYYKPSSSVTIGAAKPSSNYNPKGFMWNTANTPFQINLERNPSVAAYSTSNPPAGSVEYWNGLRSGSAMTTGNWVDPQHYALAIDPSATKMDIFTNGGSTIQENGIKWTITGWGQTVLRGTIDTTSKPGKVRLVVKNGEYRPFSADIKANPQESFTGTMYTEVVAYVYSGNIADLDTTKVGADLTGKVLEAELRADVGCLPLTCSAAKAQYKSQSCCGNTDSSSGLWM